MIIKSKLKYTFELKDLDIFISNMNSLGYDTLSSLAKDLNVSKQYLSQIINGKKSFGQEFFNKLYDYKLLRS